MCVYVCFEHTPCVWWWWNPDEGQDLTPPQSGVWGSCELPDLSGGSCSQVLWKNSRYS